jgi:hypothetical protein
MFNPWLGLAYKAVWLLWEAQWVVAARMTRMAAALAGGRTAPAVAKQVLRAYGKRVRGNRRRLRPRRS